MRILINEVTHQVPFVVSVLPLAATAPCVREQLLEKGSLFVMTVFKLNLIPATISYIFCSLVI